MHVCPRRFNIFGFAFACIRSLTIGIELYRTARCNAVDPSMSWASMTLPPCSQRRETVVASSISVARWRNVRPIMERKLRSAFFSNISLTNWSCLVSIAYQSNLVRTFSCAQMTHTVSQNRRPFCSNFPESTKHSFHMYRTSNLSISTNDPRISFSVYFTDTGKEDDEPSEPTVFWISVCVEDYSFTQFFFVK
jgi:hypothetical protein